MTTDNHDYEVRISTEVGRWRLEISCFGKPDEIVARDMAAWDALLGTPVLQAQPSAPAKNGSEFCSQENGLPHDTVPDPLCPDHNQPMIRSTRRNANGSGWYCKARA